MTWEDGTFVRRDKVVSYLEAYAASPKAPFVFDARVTHVERDSGSWRVDSDHGTYRYTDLIIATGRDRVPVMPSWPGVDRFGKKILHASKLGEIGRYDGRKVLVIGAGNSGTDVLNHLSRANPAKVWVSIRHGPAILPTRMLGFPLHRFARLFALLPAHLVDPAPLPDGRGRSCPSRPLVHRLFPRCRCGRRTDCRRHGRETIKRGRAGR